MYIIKGYYCRFLNYKRVSAVPMADVIYIFYQYVQGVLVIMCLCCTNQFCYVNSSV